MYFGSAQHRQWGCPVTELLLGALVFAVAMGLFYGLEHWSEIDIDEHEALTREPGEAEKNKENSHD